MRTRRGCRGAFLLVWGLLWAAGGVSAAGEQGSTDKAALDKLIYDALKDMHNRAADLYNSGDANGAYRMFQGGLVMAKPLLAHRPDVQQLIDQGMQEADRQASIGQRAYGLHKTIEDVRTRLKPPAATPPPDPTKSATPPPGSSPIPSAPPLNPPPPTLPSARLPDSTNGNTPVPLPASVTPAGAAAPNGGLPQSRTLWDRLGGETNVTKIVDDLLTLTMEDKSIKFTRDGKFPVGQQKEEELKQKLVGYISSLSNGTVAYTGKDMAAAHQGMNIQGKEFDAFLESFRIAVRKNNVAAKDVDELMEKVRSTRQDIVK